MIMKSNSIVRPVTLAVPTIRAKAPYVGLDDEVGIQRIEKKNSIGLNAPNTKPIPSRVMKTKIPTMKMIAETPPTKTTT